ncbi:NAD-dependent dihydropyrimidine dehydrogenase, PreA subunit [Deinococcus hopiensis KR-140]|uniref:Ferredoxin n=2 Tax=Deinococcus TaxID=1298 RepID=A0A1W1VRZ7_9DEIO|nr:NAD-dependent dihydropyrimidine dehydrogenase, PreA subunit [Deinococcus hopiensis KR-140]
MGQPVVWLSEASALSGPGGLCILCPMPHVIVSPCIGVKDQACTEVCPVECIYDGGDQFVIHPDECIDCGACVPACPVSAIFPEEDVPGGEEEFIVKNRAHFGL